MSGGILERFIAGRDLNWAATTAVILRSRKQRCFWEIVNGTGRWRKSEIDVVFSQTDNKYHLPNHPLTRAYGTQLHTSNSVAIHAMSE